MRQQAKFFIRKNPHIKFIVISSFLILSSSCISLNLGSFKDKTDEGIKFQAPPSPYTETPKPEMDKAWKTPNNDLISFFSNCAKSNSFTSLSDFQKRLISDLKKLYHIKTKLQKNHQNIPGYYVFLDPIKKNLSKRMEIFFFKKEICFYVLTFVTSIIKRPDKNPEEIFKKFIQEFQVP